MVETLTPIPRAMSSTFLHDLASALEQEIATHEKQLRQYHATKSKMIDEIDSLDPEHSATSMKNILLTAFAFYIPERTKMNVYLFR